MGLRFYKPYTPGTRNRISYNFDMITKSKPEKTLVKLHQRSQGRNNRGVITSRPRGGGHKRRDRVIDFKRNKQGIEGNVAAIEYDPNRNSLIALIHYLDGEKRYILQPKNLGIGQKIMSGTASPLEIGNALPLEEISLGSLVHNIELVPNKGGQIVRAGGASAKILAKEGNYITLRLPSKEIRLVRKECFATIGEVGNSEAFLVRSGKAGRTRWLGKRPTVRGSAMNPCDHPHGGGEGRTSIGRVHPVTPWGKPALGVKTRKPKATSNAYILRRP